MAGPFVMRLLDVEPASALASYLLGVYLASASLLSIIPFPLRAR